MQFVFSFCSFKRRAQHNSGEGCEFSKLMSNINKSVLLFCSKYDTFKLSANESPSFASYALRCTTTAGYF